MPLFATPFAQLDLVRQPEQDGEPLQAFDAADEYLLNQLHERGVTAQCRVLVLNDAFGALAASLAPHVQVTSSGDSHLGFLALRKNLARNGLDLGSVRFVPASETAVGPFDHVLVKVPKTLALLEEQLIRLHGQLAPGAQVVAAGMVKHLPPGERRWASGRRRSAPTMAWPARRRARWTWSCATRRSTSSRWSATSSPGACFSRLAMPWRRAANCGSSATATWATTPSSSGCSAGSSRSRRIRSS